MAGDGAGRLPRLPGLEGAARSGFKPSSQLQPSSSRRRRLLRTDKLPLRLSGLSLLHLDVLGGAEAPY